MLEQRHLPVSSTRHSWRWLPRRSPGSVLLPVWSARRSAELGCTLHVAVRPQGGKTRPLHTAASEGAGPGVHTKAEPTWRQRAGTAPGTAFWFPHQARREGRSTPSFLHPLVLMLSLPSQCRAPSDLVALAVTLGPLQGGSCRCLRASIALLSPGCQPEAGGAVTRNPWLAEAPSKLSCLSALATYLG